MLSIRLEGPMMLLLGLLGLIAAIASGFVCFTGGGLEARPIAAIVFLASLAAIAACGIGWLMRGDGGRHAPPRLRMPQTTTPGDLFAIAIGLPIAIAGVAVFLGTFAPFFPLFPLFLLWDRQRFVKPRPPAEAPRGIAARQPRFA
jgi:hypothetical protein